MLISKLDQLNKLDSEIASRLHEPIYELMKIIFDVKQLETMLVKFDVDLEYIPLGRISFLQLRLALNVLVDIFEIISNGGTMLKLREASNKFLTLLYRIILVSVDRL